jgi:MFS family permease
MARKSAAVQPEYYGWVIVFVAFGLNVLCFGGLALVSVLIIPLSQEFGWQRGEVAASYTIASISIAIAGVAFGRVYDRYGVRALSALGAITVSACLLLLSRVSALWQLYVLYAVLGALGPGAVYIPLTAAVTNWFKGNRGFAVGIATAGATIGMGTVPFIASAVMVYTGWQDALAYLGLAYIVVAFPLVLLVRDPTKAEVVEVSTSGKLSQEETGPISPREALAWICTAIIFCCVCMAVPQVHVPALASDLGLSLERAASVLTVIMFSGAVGRVALGRISDRVGPLNTYILASLGQTAFVFWFTQASSLTSFYILAAGFGLFSGGVSMSALLTIRSLVPSRIAGTAIGLVSFFGWVGMGLGGYLGGYFFDVSGTYVVSFAMAAAIGTANLAILISFFIRLRRARRGRLGVRRVQHA